MRSKACMLAERPCTARISGAPGSPKRWAWRRPLSSWRSSSSDTRWRLAPGGRGPLDPAPRRFGQELDQRLEVVAQTIALGHADDLVQHLGLVDRRQRGEAPAAVGAHDARDREQQVPQLL